MNSYVWGDNSFLRSEGIRDVDPQIVGERIEHLLSENGGSLTPDIVLSLLSLLRIRRVSGIYIPHV